MSNNPVLLYASALAEWHEHVRVEAEGGSGRESRWPTLARPRPVRLLEAPQAAWLSAPQTPCRAPRVLQKRSSGEPNRLWFPRPLARLLPSA
jgi:hypothetical protein